MTSDNNMSQFTSDSTHSHGSYHGTSRPLLSIPTRSQPSGRVDSMSVRAHRMSANFGATLASASQPLAVLEHDIEFGPMTALDVLEMTDALVTYFGQVEELSHAIRRILSKLPTPLPDLDPAKLGADVVLSFTSGAP